MIDPIYDAPGDAAAALLRVAEVADTDDMNMVRDELARLRRMLEAGADEDDEYLAPSVTWYGIAGKERTLP